LHGSVKRVTAARRFFEGEVKAADGGGGRHTSCSPHPAQRAWPGEYSTGTQHRQGDFVSDANNALESKKHTEYKPLLASPPHWTHMKKPSPYHAIGLPRAPTERHVSHEQAAVEISEAGKRHAASPQTACAFLQRVGILDTNGQLSPHYR
jgi:hypothetical protein